MHLTLRSKLLTTIKKNDLSAVMQVPEFRGSRDVEERRVSSIFEIREGFTE